MTDASDGKRDLFISFNQADRDWATWIAWVLEANGYSVFYQDWDFRGSFIEQMHQASLRTERTLVVLSDNYLRSEFARSEAWAALARDPVGRQDRVVTIKVGPTGDLGLFSHFAYLDLTASAEADAERLLLERAKKSLDPTYRPKPPTRPRFPGQVATKPPFPTPAAGPALAVHNLPPPNSDFIGRDEPLAELRRLLTSGQGPAVITQAITGLGGIGKTQTALAYAYRHSTDYRLVWWLRAKSTAMLGADYGTLAEPLGLGPAAADQEKLRAAICRALQTADGWLLIFDDVEDPALPRTYLPPTGKGHALITSRRTDWRGIAKPLPLEVMGEAEALQLLTGRPDPEALPPADLTEAKALADDLGHLPLALAQARAYMAETGRSFASYRKLLEDARPRVLARGRASSDYPESVAKTWQLSIEAAAGMNPAARPLLELLAFFAPEALPVEVLAAAPAALPEGLRDELERDEAIAALHRSSLIGAKAGMLTVHRLVQAVTRDGLKKATAKARAAAAVRLVSAALPSRPWEPVHWPTMQALLPHALNAAAEAERVGARPEAAGVALIRTGLYLAGRASFAEAEPLYQRAAAIFEANFGPEHPDFGLSLSVLANLCRETGRYPEAEPLYRRAIDLGERILGPEHPEVAKRLENLAVLYRDTGRCAEAEPLLKRAVAIFEKARDELGQLKPAPDPNARWIATTHLAGALGNLGRLHFDQRRYAEAELLYKRSLQLDEVALGPEHPSLATRLNNLAELYRRTRRFAEAEPLYKRAVANVEKILGPEHPNIASPLHNLAELYRETGRPAEAEPLYQRVIVILEEKLPGYLPRILKDYADFLDALGSTAEAAELRARAEAIR